MKKIYSEFRKFNSIKVLNFDQNSVNPDHFHDVLFQQSNSISSVDLSSFDNRYEALNKLSTFRFFDPDFYYDDVDQKWSFVESSPFKEFIIDPSNLISFQLFSKKNFNLQLNCQVSWVQSFYVIKRFELKLEDVDSEYLKFELEKLKNSTSYFRILHYSIENLEDQYCFFSRKLAVKSKFTLKISILFFHDSFNSEEYTISFLKEGAKQNKKKNLSIRLPSHRVNEIWTKKKMYAVHDIVLYKSKFYRCLTANKACKPDKSSSIWRLFKLNVGSSFLSSKEGRDATKCFNNNIAYFVEKILGDEIFLIFYNLTGSPTLNQFFVFKDKRYRVIEILKEIKGVTVMFKVRGVQCLDFDHICWEDCLKNIVDHDFNYACCLDGSFLKVIAPMNRYDKKSYSFSLKIKELYV